jgi:hypothetical protein
LLEGARGMSRTKRALAFMAVLLCILLAINILFYVSDKKKIVKEAQTNEWSDVKITWLFSPSPSLRHYRVTYTDAKGAIQTKHVIIELTNITWRDDS